MAPCFSIISTDRTWWTIDMKPAFFSFANSLDHLVWWASCIRSNTLYHRSEVPAKTQAQFTIHFGSDKLGHHQFVELNSNIHTYNTWRKMDIHIQSYKTDLYKRSVVNMGSKLYNKLPDYIKKIELQTLQEGTEICSSSAYLLFSGRICSSTWSVQKVRAVCL
jgi:hypothetical protein